MGGIYGGPEPLSHIYGTLLVFFSLNLAFSRVSSHSTEPARPLLPRHRLLHPRSPGRQAPPPGCLTKPFKVILHGKRTERQDDARPIVLAHRQQLKQEAQPEKSQDYPSASEPPQELHKEQLQDILSRSHEGLCGGGASTHLPRGSWKATGRSSRPYRSGSFGLPR